MVRVRVIPKEEAQQTHRPKTPGVRRQRMNQFDLYAHALLDNPEQAAVFEELDEEPQRFVLSLRGAMKRAGVYAMVRKMRGRDEVRVWLTDAPPARPARATRAAVKQAAPTKGRRAQRTSA